MSTCIPTAAAVVADKSTAATASTTTTTSTLSLLGRHRQFNSLSNAAFSLSSKPNLRLISKSSRSVFTHTVAAKAQLNNAGIGETSSGATQSKSGASSKEIKNGKPSSESAPKTLASEESISEFITQVAGLIKLVDSRDIVELQMKQHDCELLIRKKEAISQLSAPPVYMMQAPSAPTAPPQLSPPISAAAPAPTPASPAPAPKPVKSSVPPLKSPMSGTFYRSPAPNAPAFVKVGDKVQKGQVVCIIEAMKLMNEIEADQAGTVIEVVAEDGKPVSLDTSLFIIQP